MDPATVSTLALSSQGWAGGLVTLFALIVGHAIADFALQTDFIASAKNRHAQLDRFFGKDGTPAHVWIWALGAHSMIHAAAVWVITGSVILAAIEMVLHWIIDYAKCDGRTNFSTDQLLHLACKVVYAILLGLGVGWVTWTP